MQSLQPPSSRHRPVLLPSKRLISRAMRMALALLIVGASQIPTNTSNTALAQAGPCSTPITNPVLCENTKPGNPATDWNLPNADAGDSSIQGYATDISFNKGDTVSFKVSTPATAYTLEIYRLGYYGGLGARKVASLQRTTAQTQPACLTNATVGLIDCGNWAVSLTWAIPTDAVSGIYIGKLVRTDTGGASHIVFIVRDDTSTSPLLFQASDTTWQAYNSYGGNSLYTGSPVGRAYKVSYNRPFNTRGVSQKDWVFNAEYPMIRFLEANGYNVSYFTGTDTDRRGNLLLNHKVFLSVGHDEYWSGQQRANVEAARTAGINLAFFSGNEVFWKTRWENSTDGSNTPNRTLVSYKETHADQVIDPADPPTWTGTWRDPRFSPPADGGRPENALTGTIFTVNGPRTDSITVPADDGKMRLWRNTDVAGQAIGQSITLPAGTLGNEWDEDLDNGFRPSGLVRLSTTTLPVTTYVQDYGSTYGSGAATHSLTLYRHTSGALVFSAGTIQWSWGLDANHDRPSVGADIRMQQATLNLLADMGVQPASPQAGLVAASKSTDTSPPTSTIVSPVQGATLQSGGAVSITGTADDTGGVVGGVEVSVDGGTTWHRAQGRANWSYSWTPNGVGSVTIKSRAVDDSGNIETPGAGVTVTASCPCSIFGGSTPTVASTADSASVELGVKFRSDVAGYVTGVRFYKGSANAGTHIGSLWSSTGSRLGQATFSGETATGWQSISFPAPVAISANTTYVASYFAPQGGYARNLDFFTTTGTDTSPLHALSNTLAAGNGVYAYGATSSFPSNTYQSSNYWVDIVFTTTPPPPDTTPPTISNLQASAVTSGGATIAWTTNEPGDTQVEYGSTVAYGSTTTLDPSLVTNHSAVVSGLQASTTYHYRVKSKDASNNLATSSDSTFTTAATPACPCSVWSGSAIPATDSQPDTNSIELGLKFSSDVAGYITGIRFYRGSANTGTHTGSLWSSAGTRLAQATFTGETASGWQQVIFPAAVPISAKTTYVASYFAPQGGYSITRSYFAAAGTDSGSLHALSDTAAGGNGTYRYATGSAFPTNSFQATNYWVDVVFTTSPPGPDTTPPVISNIQANNVTSTGAAIGWSTDEAADSQLEYGLTPAYGSTTTLDPALVVSHVVALTGLQSAKTYHYRVKSKDASNNLATSGDFTFSTTAPAACPCSIWSSASTPAVASASDTGSVELGMKFRSDVDGYIRGIRFYKGPTNGGTHIANMWTSAGTRLAQATVSGETASGWQTATFASSVAVTANTTYIASYFAPVGGYARDLDYFTVSGVDSGSLHALSSPASGGNGVYQYTATSQFPINAFQGSNYWVDVIFSSVP